MKVTDYCPRAAAFDSYLPRGRELVGAEIGVDVGAHAQALLQHCSIAVLNLIDPWPNPWCRGYCEGRLSALGFRRRYVAWAETSANAARRFAPASLDFVYIDQEHDGPSVAMDLKVWWPIVAPGGVLGYRNYRGAGTPLDLAVDGFVSTYGGAGRIKQSVEEGEVNLTKCA